MRDQCGITLDEQLLDLVDQRGILGGGARRAVSAGQMLAHLLTDGIVGLTTRHGISQAVHVSLT